MNVFSLCFIFVWLISILFYYSVLKKHQWVVLLCASIFLYIISVQGFPVVLVIVIGITYAASRYIYIHKEKGGKSDHKLRLIRNGAVALCVVVLALGRHTNFFVTLGNSYFTLKAIGYLIDCERYDDKAYYESNIFFYTLYLIFFPTIAQGPFNRYKDFKKQFVSGYIKFDYIRVMHGLQRFLWGMMKKLVVVPRLANIGEFVFEDITGKSGLTLIVGIVAQTMYYYTDFSSYMDMMIGISSSFGIEIPENFRQPFFSKSVAEFWRRWHITLGDWFKDYVFMPLLTSSLVNKVGKWTKTHIGKKVGGYVISVFPIVSVWLLTGLWHGTGWDYVIWGMYYCVIISISTILAKSYTKWKKKIGIRENSFFYALFCYLRTVALVLIANIILAAGSVDRFVYIFRTIAGKSFICGEYIRLSSIGWKPLDVVVVLIGMLAMTIVALIKEQGKDICTLVDKTALPIRWGLYYTLIFAAIIFGIYGSGYDTSTFMYSNF